MTDPVQPLSEETADSVHPAVSPPDVPFGRSQIEGRALPTDAPALEALLKAARDAATSLETIFRLAGRMTYGEPPIETHMDTFMDVRLYAAARARAAREEIASALTSVDLSASAGDRRDVESLQQTARDAERLGRADETYRRAVAQTLLFGHPSVSLVQRRLGIPYMEAQELVARMVRDGIYGPEDLADSNRKESPHA